MRESYPPYDYIIGLIEAEGLVDKFNEYAENSGVPVLVALLRFYDQMDVPFF